MKHIDDILDKKFKDDEKKKIDKNYTASDQSDTNNDLLIFTHDYFLRS